MKAIRNKKTGRLLSFDVETYETWEYGVTEEVRTIKKFLALSDSKFGHNIFVTTDSSLLEDLLKSGKTTYPNIRIYDVELTDLEIVNLTIEN